MKILKIENKVAYFLNDKGENKNIREISKDDIYSIMSKMFDAVTPEALYDNFTDGVSEINNPAERIIYENLIEHIKQFISTIPEIKTEIREKFKDFE